MHEQGVSTQDACVQTTLAGEGASDDVDASQDPLALVTPNTEFRQLQASLDDARGLGSVPSSFKGKRAPKVDDGFKPVFSRARDPRPLGRDGMPLMGFEGCARAPAQDEPLAETLDRQASMDDPTRFSGPSQHHELLFRAHVDTRWQGRSDDDPSPCGRPPSDSTR